MRGTTIRTLGLVAVLGGAVAACGTDPAIEESAAAIARADASVEHAEKSGGREYGATELDMAREKLARAKAEADSGYLGTAIRLAEQASVDAELASAEGQAGQSEKALEQLRESTSTLRQELHRQQQIESTSPVEP